MLQILYKSKNASWIYEAFYDFYILFKVYDWLLALMEAASFACKAKI
jgi:hypothetical protein